MLVITLRPGDEFYVGPDIVVRILPPRNNQASRQTRIGIDAPPDLAVVRGGQRYPENKRPTRED